MAIIDNVHLMNMIESLEKELDAKQAKIDALMLEYCSDEVTDEQWEEYQKHQVIVKMDWNWKQLTEEEIDDVIDKTYGKCDQQEVTWDRHNFAKELIKKFMEKNK